MMDLEKKPTGCTFQIFRYLFLFVMVVWLILSLAVAWLQSNGIAVINISGALGQTTAQVQVPFPTAMLGSMWFFGIACFGPFFMVSLLYFVLVGMKKRDANSPNESSVK